MKEWKKCQEEAAKRDHRKRGRACTFLNLQTFYILSFFFFNSSYDQLCYLINYNTPVCVPLIS